VEIAYTGKLRPAFSLIARHWDAGRRGSASSNGVTLSADAPRRVKAGAAATVRVRASGDRLAGSTIVIGPSGLLDIDLAALMALAGPGKSIADVRTTDRGLELLVAAKEVSIALPYFTARR